MCYCLNHSDETQYLVSSLLLVVLNICWIPPVFFTRLFLIYANHLNFSRCKTENFRFSIRVSLTSEMSIVSLQVSSFLITTIFQKFIPPLYQSPRRLHQSVYVRSVYTRRFFVVRQSSITDRNMLEKCYVWIHIDQHSPRLLNDCWWKSARG